MKDVGRESWGVGRGARGIFLSPLATRRLPFGDVLGVAMFLLLNGCSSQTTSMPPTYPVTGSVLREDGRPYRRGSLQFKPDSNEDITVRGDIEEDGTFRLHTLKGTERTDGAPAGAYEVTIAPALGPDRKAPFPTFIAPKKYQVEAGENDLEIKTDPPS